MFLYFYQRLCLLKILAQQKIYANLTHFVCEPKIVTNVVFIYWICIHKTLKFEDDIIHNKTIYLFSAQLRYVMFIKLFNHKLSLKVVFIFLSFIFTNVFIFSAFLKSSNNWCLKPFVIDFKRLLSKRSSFNSHF